MPDEEPDRRATRRRSQLVVALTAVSGYIDAVGVVALGGAFTSVMTGNLVLTGVGSARPDHRLLLISVSAIVCYVAACLIGARIAGRPGEQDPPWPPVCTRVLGIEVAMFTVFAAGWWAGGTRTGLGVQLPLLLVNALALGLQSAAVQRLNVSGLSTTFFTGTLTSIAAAVGTGRPWRHYRRAVVQVLVLVLGGALGAVTALHLPGAVPVLPLLGVAVVMALAPRRRQVPLSG